MCKGCRMEAAQEPQPPSGHFALSRAKVGSGKACKLSAGEGAHWALGRAEPRREGGRQEGRVTALGAGRPFGIWSRCAWVLRFKEFSKSPSIWAPSLLPARRGAEQMVCKQNSFGSGGEGDLSKVAGARPQHRERGSGSSISPGRAGVWLWAGRLCGSWGCWCPCKPPHGCPVRALIPNPALQSWLGAARPLCLASLSSPTSAPHALLNVGSLCRSRC